MFDLNSISIKNLRSLKDTGEIDIKPITILVGKNSVGKSTFLRSFPLLRQSCEKKTRSPILWYGNLVDFGEFQNSLNRDSARNIENSYIEFGFNLSVGKPFRYLVHEYNNEPFSINVKLQIKENNKTSYASKLCINFLENDLVLNLNNNQEFDSINFNGNSYNNDFLANKNCKIRIFTRKILPALQISRTYRMKDHKIEYEKEVNLFSELLDSEIKKLCRNNVKEETVEALIKNIPFSDKSSIYKYFTNQSLISSLGKKIRKNGVDHEVFTLINNYFILSKLQELILYIDEGLSNSYSSVRYLEPLRATAQRYYRRQELAIDEIDSKGSNIAMFLDSLNQSEKQNLNKVLSDNFNIELNIKRESGHLALTIKTPDLKEDTNLADLGVGYSQILPFIIQMWDINNYKRGNKHKSLGLFRTQQKSYFVVEQPELHLHPAYQAKIADVIDKILDKSKLNVVIETHSPHLIYRFGELIEENNSNISKHDIQVLIFEEINGETKIRKSVFDDEGRLQNWPIGFFQP